MLIIGSYALLEYTCGADRKAGVPKDVDVICTHDEAVEYDRKYPFARVFPSRDGRKLYGFSGSALPIEFEIAWPGTSAEIILERTKDLPISVEGSKHFAPLNVQYLLKMSHRFLKDSPHFEKTWYDISLLRYLGAVIEWPDVLAQREKETYIYPHPKLNVSKQAFFDPNSVEYIYDHDSIHRAMALDPLKPAYDKFKSDPTTVKVDKQLFDAQPYAVQLASVLEESYVLALERSQIPFEFKPLPLKSFTTALQKVCTSITSGWWRDFAWEQYDEALKQYDPLYVEKFHAAVKTGVVQPFGKG